MQVREYLSVRRAYGLVRQDMTVSERLTFEEFAILCHLHYADRPLRTSEIADYQNVLRPTMTHRTNHLAQAGLIERASGVDDKRTVCCVVSDRGERLIASLAQMCTERITAGMALNRAEPERMLRYANAMGELYLTSGDLVLIALGAHGSGSMKITDLVDVLGLLQPTVSMSVRELAREGLLVRDGRRPDSPRAGEIVLTDAGAALAGRLGSEIEELVVRRKSRK